MKKTNKYRNNNNTNTNTIFSLNYKFDSNSIAGKFNGTALELIKRYNDLAKDAHSNSDYVNAEIFRQYAEHYRKIVTEINERKNSRAAEAQETKNNAIDDDQYLTPPTKNENTQTQDEVDTQVINVENNSSTSSDEVENPEEQNSVKSKSRKSFKVIEISDAKNQEKSKPLTKKLKSEENSSTDTEEKKETPAPKRQYRRKTAAV